MQGQCESKYKKLDEYFENKKPDKILLVCGNSIKKLEIGKYFDSLEENTGIQVIRFSDFTPNPTYESVVKGVKLAASYDIKVIVAVGGGSAMDVAKCIKLYSGMDHSRSYLEQDIVPNDIDLIAVPTTSGSGSEVTRFAVIYHNGEKQSITDYSCIPSLVIYDWTVLKTLPLYQKKSTMLDALCHAIESYWSVSSTDESKDYARQAIRLIMENKDKYLDNTDEGNQKMLEASSLAGRAINITMTTAGHAMCYKITTLFSTAHGHACALCVNELFPYMLENLDKCTDPRGLEYLAKTLKEITDVMGRSFGEFYESLELDKPEPEAGQFEILKKSVNTERLMNHPIALDLDTIDYLYHKIFAVS